MWPKYFSVIGLPPINVQYPLFPGCSKYYETLACNRRISFEERRCGLLFVVLSAKCILENRFLVILMQQYSL